MLQVWRILTSQSVKVDFETNRTPDKIDHTMWKGIPYSVIQFFQKLYAFFEATCAPRKMWRPKSLPVSIHRNAVSLRLIYWGLLSMKNPLSSKWQQLYIISITHKIPPEQTRDKKTDWESLRVKIEVYFKRSFSIASCILLSIYTSKLLKNYNLKCRLNVAVKSIGNFQKAQLAILFRP